MIWVAWDGYFVFSGNEFINVARTEAYAQNLRVGWFRPLYNNDALPLILGETYRTPFLDEAPWVDADRPESTGFLGLYPLSVTGLDDSTSTASVIEGIGDGGQPGRPRNATRSVVFSGVLVALSDAAADYGMRWLRQVISGDPCAPVGCSGGDLCYLYATPQVDYNPEYALTYSAAGIHIDTVIDGGSPSSEPFESVVDGGFPGSQYEHVVDGGTPGVPTLTLVDAPDYTDCYEEYERSLRRVTFTSAPAVTAKRTTSDGGAVWTVTFTATAGIPYEFGAERDIIRGFLDPDVEDPWQITPGFIDRDGYIAQEQNCTPPAYQPVYDPLCPAVITPPSVPSLSLGCDNLPANWRRRQFSIPAEEVKAWMDMVPRVRIHARTREVRNLRLRFYADPNGDFSIEDDPCAYCGDILISYIPLGSTLVFDGAEQRVYVETPGMQRRRADSLVFRTDGNPFDWPMLTCGFGYIVTLDLPQTQMPPVVDLSLVPRVI